MKNQLISTAAGNSVSEVLAALGLENPAFYMFFFGADADVESITAGLKKTGVPFMGCMDAGRLSDNKYFLDTKSISAMALSRELFEGMAFETVEMGSSVARDTISHQSAEALKKAAEKCGINLDNPDMERDFAINILYGLDSANSFLEGQAVAGMMLQSVGGSSGGKTDFVSSSVISHLKSGSIGIVGLFKLKPQYAFIMDRVSSFEALGGKNLVITELKGPRNIQGINGNSAVDEYCKAVGIDRSKLGPQTFADFTLGIDPGDGEILVTSIMAADNSGSGLLTYNDVIEGTEFTVYRAVSQRIDRQKMLEKVKSKHAVGYISFDCILCYLARNTLNQVHDIASLYGEILPSVPKIGFGTFSENICGANINQTETFIAIYKK
ncbi:MAG: FIST C-terminal domain-containing protein [Spirochaetales bacterium]|nr:FIST C-terminal domain-containing protein [Spirochaetales bacterium]